MDPNVLFNSEWAEIGKSLTFLWAAAFCVILGSGNILLGHVILPSLIDSYHIPKSLQKARLMFYAIAIAIYAAAAWLIIQFVIGSNNVISRFWNDYWI